MDYALCINGALAFMFILSFCLIFFGHVMPYPKRQCVTILPMRAVTLLLKITNNF